VGAIFSMVESDIALGLDLTEAAREQTPACVGSRERAEQAQGPQCLPQG
jgi:hypothetical protein